MTRNIATAPGLAALALIMATPAHAESGAIAGGSSCFGSIFGSRSCVWNQGPMQHPNVRTVPQALSAEEGARADARDKRWVERCSPRIRQDDFGVPRYVYAARGCEYGRLD
jgi:hypothetical protein